jgi:hypothetical protein
MTHAAKLGLAIIVLVIGLGIYFTPAAQQVKDVVPFPLGVTPVTAPIAGAMAFYVRSDGVVIACSAYIESAGGYGSLPKATAGNCVTIPGAPR